jgi:steroid delta-isomerase-like uncharacterized protein
MTGLLIVTILGCQAPAPPAAPPPVDHAAKLGPAIEEIFEVWNTKEYDRLDAILAADFRREAPDQEAEGIDGMKEFMGQVHTTYPDFRIVADETYFDKDVAIVVWTVTGTNTGEGALPPTGKSVEIRGMTICRFRDGKIYEEDVFYDTAGVSEQLGLEAVPHAKTG